MGSKTHLEPKKILKGIVRERGMDSGRTVAAAALYLGERLDALSEREAGAVGVMAQTIAGGPKKDPEDAWHEALKRLWPRQRAESEEMAAARDRVHRAGAAASHAFRGVIEAAERAGSAARASLEAADSPAGEECQRCKRSLVAGGVRIAEEDSGEIVATSTESGAEVIRFRGLRDLAWWVRFLSDAAEAFRSAP
jgi:hypothetical protein